VRRIPYGRDLGFLDRIIIIIIIIIIMYFSRYTLKHIQFLPLTEN
jgi:hypothetical protein